MLHRFLPLLLLLTLLPAGTAGAAQYQDLGCYADPEGDAAGVADADVVDFCINYAEGADIIRFVVDLAGNADPDSDAGWANDDTQVQIAIAVEGEAEPSFVVRIARFGDELDIRSTPSGGGPECDGRVVLSTAGQLAADLPPSCFDTPASLEAFVTMTYEPEEGAAVGMDRAPDAGRTSSLTGAAPEPPVCDNAAVDPDDVVTIRRVRCGIGGTEPISQGAATSQFVFDDLDTPAIDPYTADWAVIARDDDFPDALAGTSLSFGQGPLLFTHSPASAAALGQDPARLATITRAELLRVLPRGRTVYLLGGSAALSPGLDQELTDLGYQVVRFAGAGREQTARLIAAEVRRLVQDFAERTSFPDVNMVLIASAGNWPDAVVAGSVGAYWGMPILLTGPDVLHPETEAALAEMNFDYAHIMGGQAVVTTDVLNQIRPYVDGREGVDLESDPWQSFCARRDEQGNITERLYGCRWGGSDRLGTAFAVGQLNRDMNRRFGAMHPLIPEEEFRYAVGVNLRRGDAFSFAMSAATVSGRLGGAVFIPAEGADGSVLRDDIAGFMCFNIRDLNEFLLIGDTDVLTDGFGLAVRDHITNIDTICPE